LNSFGSEVKNLCIRGEIHEMRASVQKHVGKEFGLVNLTSLGAGNSDPDRDFMLYQVGQIILWTIAGYCFDRKIPGGIGPFHASVDKKNIYLVSFFAGDFRKLKTSGRLFIVILSKREQKIRHLRPPFSGVMSNRLHAVSPHCPNYTFIPLKCEEFMDLLMQCFRQLLLRQPYE
jgi:hypothetical protein